MSSILTVWLKSVNHTHKNQTIELGIVLLTIRTSPPPRMRGMASACTSVGRLDSKEKFYYISTKLTMMWMKTCRISQVQNSHEIMRLLYTYSHSMSSTALQISGSKPNSTKQWK